MSYDTSSLPSYVKTVLITGAGGFVGQRLLQVLLDRYSDLEIVVTDIRTPPTNVRGSERVISLAADLADPASVARLFEGRQIDTVFALHGIMSGGSEQDFDLGYQVNVDSHLVLLKAVTAHHRAARHGLSLPLYVQSSGLAVYGGPKCSPKATVAPDDTPLFPETSYGVQKAITELYVFDYTRKGFIDGRILRLPTVAIRAGAPSSAASSFISGLIREPLQGQRSLCPVADSMEDSNLDTFPVYLARVQTIIHNLIHALSIPASSFPPHSRAINLPGITTTTRGILDALVKVGGPAALDLIDFRRDPKVLHIMSAWPGAFNSDAALSLGFKQDDERTGFEDAVRDFKRELDELE